MCQEERGRFTPEGVRFPAALDDERSRNFCGLIIGVARLDDDLKRIVAARGVAVAAAGLTAER